MKGWPKGKNRKNYKNNRWTIWKNGKAIYEERKCICGCNYKFICKINSKQKFIHGHNTKLRKGNSKLLELGRGWNKGLTKETDKRLFKSAIKSSISHKGKHTGKNCNFWKGGITELYNLIKSLEKYKNWRKQTFERDYYICQECYKTNCYLQAHHIRPFSEILQEFLNKYNQFSLIEDKETLLRLAISYEPFWDINNGKTLCEDCHNLTKEGRPHAS